MAPEAAQQPCNHQILLGLREGTQPRSRLATFQEHGPKLIVGLEESHRRISVPEPQPMDFVLAFQMRHANLQYRGGPVRERHRRYPRATYLFVIERRTKRQRPSPRQISQGVRQPVEPCRALRRHAAVSREPLRNIHWLRSLAHKPDSVSRVVPRRVVNSSVINTQQGAVSQIGPRKQKDQRRFAPDVAGFTFTSTS